MHQEDELKRETREAQPMQSTNRADPPTEESLPQILAELNTQFGPDFNENDAVCILAIEERLHKREDLKDNLQVMKLDDVLPIFSQAVMEILKSMVETDYKFYNHVANKRDFAECFAQYFLERDLWQKKG